MSSKKQKHARKSTSALNGHLKSFFPGTNKPLIDPSELLNLLPDGGEYKKLIDVATQKTVLPVDVIKVILAEIQKIRGRSVVCYVGNTIRGGSRSSISNEDDLPFNEMIRTIPETEKEIDVILVTNGGLIDQVPKFVNTLRPRFDVVNFILPDMCMSAGTLWALSGNSICMRKDSYIGPIDPQLPDKTGQYGPIQSLLNLVHHIQKETDELLKNGTPLPWTYIQIINQIPYDRLGMSITLTEHAKRIAASYLREYKFRDWTTHSTTGAPVTEQEKSDRADYVAGLLAQNSHWKSHGHCINRGRAWDELKLKIDRAEDFSGLESQLRKLIAVFRLTFDDGRIEKFFVSSEYNLLFFKIEEVAR
ncbi:MAG: hypothetical protein HY916_09075 [Desulfovibrio sp.]|nr:hypothetical protein [Desulfovibrio sp.]